MPLLSAKAFSLDRILVVRGRSTAAISTVRLSLNDILVSADSQRLIFLSRLGVNLFVGDQVFTTSLAVWIERRHIVLGEGYFALPLHLHRGLSSLLLQRFECYCAAVTVSLIDLWALALDQDVLLDRLMHAPCTRGASASFA